MVTGLDHNLAREITNGIWFVLSLEVWLCFLFYVYHRMIKEAAEPRWVFVTPEPWHRELGTQLAIAWSFYIAGSTFRAGWIWVFLECNNRLGRGNCGHVTETAEWLYLASLLAIIGGTWMMARILPERWGRARIIAPPTIAIVLPIIVHIAI